MIKTLQTKRRLGSLKSDCQFHSYHGAGERERDGARHSRKWGGGIYEPGVEFDWAMIIPSRMIIVGRSSDPVHDKTSHCPLSLSPSVSLLLSTSLGERQLSYSGKNTCSRNKERYEPLAGAAEYSQEYLLTEPWAAEIVPGRHVLPQAQRLHSAATQSKGSTM